MSIGTSTGVDVERLRPLVKGRVITPDDADYDAARRLFSGALDRYPAALVRVADADDVARVVTFARDDGIELTVKSGGHSAAGHSVGNGALVIDLADLNALTVADDGTIWAGSGLTASEVTQTLGERGLALGFGDTGSVGIGGITLGGGVGYLSRLYGLTIDDLLAAEIVTADGEVRVVDAETEPDLFWAIRGGGGNFGVVTRFRFRPHELTGVYGGMLMLPASAEVVAGFIELAEAAPDELGTIANVMPAPPMPFVPESHHGQLVVMGMLAWAGDAESGERAVAPFRALAEPIVDMVRPIAVAELYPPEDESYRPTAASLTLFVDRFDKAAAHRVFERLESFDAPMRVAQLRVLGGAIARVPNDATAYAHRDRRMMANVAAFYVGAEDQPVKERWVADFADELRDGSAPGAYVNFLADEGPERVREAYPGPTWDRLRAIKRRYDPDNLFRGNQNIPPAEAA